MVWMLSSFVLLVATRVNRGAETQESEAGFWVLGILIVASAACLLALGWAQARKRRQQNRPTSPAV